MFLAKRQNFPIMCQFWHFHRTSKNKNKQKKNKKKERKKENKYKKAKKKTAFRLRLFFSSVGHCSY
jgi:hypothetical protein